MFFNTRSLLSVASSLALLGGFSTASSLTIKRQEVLSAGTIVEPADNTPIAGGSVFNFTYGSYNYCYSGYEPVTAWLLAQDPTTASVNSSGGFDVYVYYFGEWVVNNFGLPEISPGPLPSNLTMPALTNYVNATLYFTVVETYTSCPVYFPAEYGLVSNPVLVNPL